jgi:hypothetical protein
MKSQQEIFARAVVNAWQNGEPDGLLLIGLYVSCGMTREEAIAEAEILNTMGEE